jgi:hypothetical protein
MSAHFEYLDNLDTQDTQRSCYEFIRNENNILFFAKVSLLVEEAEHSVQVYNGFSMDEFIRMPPSQKHWYRSWIGSARMGARTAALHLQNQGLISGSRITVLSVMGSVRETTINAVFCAALMATWQGLKIDIPLPELDYIDGRWVPYLAATA